MKVSLCNAILDMTVEEKKDRNGQFIYILDSPGYASRKRAIVLLRVKTVIAIHVNTSSVTDGVYVN